MVQTGEPLFPLPPFIKALQGARTKQTQRVEAAHLSLEHLELPLVQSFLESDGHFGASIQVTA